MILAPLFYSTLIRFIVYTHTPLSACCGLSSKTFGWLYSRRPWGVVLVYITKIVFGCARGFYISSLLCHTHTHTTQSVCAVYSLSFFMSESITLYYVYVHFLFCFHGSLFVWLMKQSRRQTLPARNQLWHDTHRLYISCRLFLIFHSAYGSIQHLDTPFV